MRSKLIPAQSLVFLIAFATCHVSGQVAPAATKNQLPLAVGVGFSGYDSGWNGTLFGGTLWINYVPNWTPDWLRGLGLEIEARDLNYGRSGSEPAKMREDIAQGGLIYSWPHFLKFRPYAKFSAGYGNAEYLVYNYATDTDNLRYHQSRTILSEGGGAEYQLGRKIWLRADFEYQSWPDFFKHPGTPIPAGKLNPWGFTMGAMYHFGSLRLH
ncbi:MAG: outer membrane beta-barrel protein [Terracidiphilus sp.]